MHSLLIPIVTFVLYSLLAAYFWRAQSRGEGDVMSYGGAGHLVLVPLALHGYLLGQDIFSRGDFDLGILNALSLIVWLTLLVYWVARFFLPDRRFPGHCAAPGCSDHAVAGAVSL